MRVKFAIPIRRLTGDGGQNLIEYALALVFFFMMMFGIVEFSRALYAYHFVSNAAREATRWAAVNGATCGPGPSSTACPSCDSTCNGSSNSPIYNSGPASASDIQTYVTDIAPPGIDRTQITTTPAWTAPPGSPADCASTPNSPGCTVEVTVSYNFHFVAPIVSTATVNMSSTSEMVIAH